MRLFEILCEAADYAWTYENSASFKTNNVLYGVDFIPLYGKDNQYDVEFQPAYGSRFGNNNNMGSASITVFSTVIAIMNDFIKKNQPDVIRVAADKANNRVGLYSKLVKKLDTQNYSISSQDAGKEVIFTATKDQMTNEAVIKLGKKPINSDSPASKFMDELSEVSKENPFNLRKRVIGTATVECYIDRDNIVHLSDIMGSNGSGSAALKLLCDLADKNDVILELFAKGYAHVSTDDLVPWYKKYGFFELNMDDPYYDEGIEMHRNPN